MRTNVNYRRVFSNDELRLNLVLNLKLSLTIKDLASTSLNVQPLVIPARWESTIQVESTWFTLECRLSRSISRSDNSLPPALVTLDSLEFNHLIRICVVTIVATSKYELVLDTWNETYCIPNYSYSTLSSLNYRDLWFLWSSSCVTYTWVLATYVTNFAYAWVLATDFTWLVAADKSYSHYSKSCK